MTTKTTKAPSIEKGWEIKNRTYVLTGNRSPISWTIQTKHTARKPLLYFDETNAMAMPTFAYSIIYLAALFAAMLIDHFLSL